MVKMQQLVKELPLEYRHSSYTLLKRLPILPVGKRDMKGKYNYKLDDILHCLRTRETRAEKAKEMTKLLIKIVQKKQEERDVLS